MPGTRLRWNVDGLDWPHRVTSRFAEAGGVRWHYQRVGAGAAILLLHGTGASTHSWRDLVPGLAAGHAVVAVDLPGHAFSAPGPAVASTLPGMTAALAALLRQLAIVPAAIVGHSAGAAVAARLVLERYLPPVPVFAVNGAFFPLRGLSGAVFPAIARVFAASPGVARLSAWRGRDRGAVERLIGMTGSRLDAHGVDLYARLLRDPGHVAGALRMMAHWDLRGLAADLSRLASPLHLVVGTNDLTVSPHQSETIHACVPGSTLTRLAGLGHLAHEEAPGQVVALVRSRLVTRPMADLAGRD